MATKKTQSDTTPKATRANPLALGTPRITEKAAKLAGMNAYTFAVAVGVTKSEIAKAFADRYGKKPLKVNIINEKPKTFWRRGVLGVAKRTKKAYVILPKGVTIDIM